MSDMDHDAMRRYCDWAYEHHRGDQAFWDDLRVQLVAAAERLDDDLGRVFEGLRALHA